MSESTVIKMDGSCFQERKPTTFSVLDLKEHYPKKCEDVFLQKNKATKNLLLTVQNQNLLESQSQSLINDNSLFYLSYFETMKKRMKELELMQSPTRSPIKPFKIKNVSKLKNQERILKKLDTMIQLKNSGSKQKSSCKTMQNITYTEERKSLKCGYLHTLFREKSSESKQIPSIFIKKEVDLKIKTKNSHFGNKTKKLIKIVNESRLNA